MKVGFDHLSRAELDHQLSPSRSAKDAGGVLARHVQETAAVLADPGLRVRRDVAYGPGAAERFDLVSPAGKGPFPCLIFVHGGFWQEGSKAGSGFAARALAERGWASALIGYSLAPEASLTEILTEIACAVEHIAANADALGVDPKNIILAGHSAGGHLTAAILSGKGGPEAAYAISGAVLISGVFDLAPIAASYVNDLVRMDAAEVQALSLLDARPLRPVPVLVLVGGDETQSFRDQSTALCAAWDGACRPLVQHIATGCDHFDILDVLSKANGTPLAAILEMRV